MRIRMLRLTGLLAVAAGAFLPGCGGDGNGDGGTGINPTIAISLSSTALAVMQGTTGTVNLTLTRGGGFAAAVAISVEGAPAGVTAAAEPTSIPAGSGASVIRIEAAGTTTPGNYTLTVRGTGSGVAATTTAITLTVTAAPAGDFTIAVAPAVVPVQQGSAVMATVTLTRTGGFTGAVALTATGLPAGVTAAFNPQSPTTGNSTLTLTASATAAVGQATVTIRGAAQPLAERTATLTVNVSAAAAANTTWDFCSAADMPLWLARQDGNGTWVRVTPVGTRFQFNIASGTGGVAFVSTATDGAAPLFRTSRPFAAMRTVSSERRRLSGASAAPRTTAALVDGFDVTIVYGTQPELNAQGTSQCLPGAGKTVNGSIANVSAAEIATIGLGDASVDVSGGTSSFQLTGVQDGALDLLASRGSFDVTTFTNTVNRMIIRRGLNPPNNSTLPVLDFNAAEAFAPVEANITLANLGADAALVITSFSTASGTGGFTLFSGLGGGGPIKYYGVPTARQIAGDLHFGLVVAAPPAQNADIARFAGLFFGSPTDRSVALGATLPAQTITVASSAPYARLRAQGTVTAAYGKYIEVSFTQETSAVLRFASVNVSAGYLANATSYDVTIPDFTSVTGWDNNWGPRNGTPTAWNVTGIGFTGTGVSGPTPADGATIQGALRTGTITP